METLKSLREFICFNQKELIQYEYLISEKHKALRKNLKSTVNIDECIDELLDVAYNNLLDVFEKNIGHISNIFKSIGIDVEPRITIKTVEDDNVFDLFRSNGESLGTLSKIKDNTGFSTIVESLDKMHFMSNNLENDFIENRYKNPRLDETLKNNLKLEKVEWKDCWKPITGNEKLDYSSTLIIPMAIRLDEHDAKEFADQFFRLKNQKHGSRTIWGFLCFDYVEKDIFVEKEDKALDAGYIIADILSLYIMFFYNHIIGSKTFNDAMQLMKQSNNTNL